MTDERKAELRGLCDNAYRFSAGETDSAVVAPLWACCGIHVPELLDEVDRLSSELAAMTRERDAAVTDLSEIDKCDVCKHQVGATYCGGDCEACTLEGCVCRNCHNDDKWEWRGPVAAEGENHENHYDAH